MSDVSIRLYGQNEEQTTKPRIFPLTKDIWEHMRERHTKMKLRFYSHTSIIPSRLAHKMSANCPGIKLVLEAWGQNGQIEIFSSRVCIVHETKTQVISRGGKKENGCEIPKNKKCTCKAAKMLFFNVKYAYL